ncbi:hypothetical protein BGZ99_001138 [Dissophora globulifera]|uniref:Protein kinase domain-containing protein n=1 Tax=Dissophora globulifera TaxID=979702 RepID=A0A9P6UKT9_9FUNG|nr:hypothetical protein BGZ99_001138 [Dissophora globulifera]
MHTRDSGTALESAANSPPHSQRNHLLTKAHSSPPMSQSTPTNNITNNDINGYAAPSVPHFTATPGADSPSKANDLHHDCDFKGAAAFGVNNNTEAASRMVAEANQQKNMLPVYPGLERFNLVEKMGDGAFSNVFKAYDTKTDRLVAVKVVRKFDMNAHQRANILKEVQIMRQLKQPNIVELYEFFESDEYYFLVLELATGGELFHRIVKLTYLSEDLARHVIVQVAHAIRYLHEEKGVIHRDIKPENILFEPIPIIPSAPGFRPDEEDKEDEGVFQPGVGGGGIGRVKIADFGLSKVVWNEQTMTPCGTVGYTAPEIVKDERYSKSVDMWAMGCVLYTLLVGFPPFYDESIQALTEKVARGQFTFLSPWWDEISLEAQDLISHLLCVDPKERYTINQFLSHPWIKSGEPLVQEQPEDALSKAAPEISIASPGPAFAENKVLASVAAMTPEYGAPRTPRTPYRRRAENPLSPGIGLKEVFDVSNAVHRMGEESRRRHTPQPAGLQPDARQRQAFMTQLNEEDEEMHSDHSGSGSGSGGSEDESMAVGMSDVRIGGQSQDLNRQQKEYRRAQEQIAAEKHHKYLSQQQQAGQPIPKHHIAPSSLGGSSTTRSGYTTGTNSTASTTSSSASRSRRSGFQLNMNQATLLKRRAKHTVECQEQAMRQSPALVV